MRGVRRAGMNSAKAGHSPPRGCAESERRVIQTQHELAPSYTRFSSSVDAARARAERADNSPWLFALACGSFALTLATLIYLSQISF